MEPFLTACCRMCGVPSAEDNIDGAIAAGMAAMAERPGTPARRGGGDVVPLADYRGKPFKSEDDKKNAMQEAGTAGVYKELQDMPGFESYSEDFQEKVELFERTARLAWKSAPQAMAAEQEAEMKRFSETKMALLRPQVVSYLPILADEKQTWERGTEMSRRHDLYCTYLFLTGMVEKFYSSAKEKNIAGIYALLSSARKWVTGTISAPDFFSRTTREVFSEYMDVAEPRFMALSRLCGVPLPPFVDGISAEHHNAFAIYNEVNRSLPGYKEDS
jgi:hypothetical protein